MGAKKFKLKKFMWFFRPLSNHFQRSGLSTRMLCKFCMPTLGAISLGVCTNRPEALADKMYRACDVKDQALKKIRTLHVSE